MELPTRRQLHARRQWFQLWWVWAFLLVVVAAGGFLAGRAAGQGSAPGFDMGAPVSEAAQSSPEQLQPQSAPAREVAGGADPQSVGPLPLEAEGYPSFPAQTVSGSGEKTLGGLALPGPVALSIDCPACEGPVSVRTNLADDPFPVDVDGPFAGTVVLATGDQSLEEVTVGADGDWTVLIGDLDNLPKIAGYMDAMGVNSFIYTGKADSAEVTHTGAGEFQLYVYGLQADPVVQETGEYQAKIPLAPGVVSVRTLGEWSFTPQE